MKNHKALQPYCLRFSAILLGVMAFSDVHTRIASAFSPCACCDSSYSSCSDAAEEQLIRSGDSCSGVYEVNGPEQCFDNMTANNSERSFECSNCYESAWNNYQNLQQLCANEWWNCSDNCTGWGQGAVNGNRLVIPTHRAI